MNDKKTNSDTNAFSEPVLQSKLEFLNRQIKKIETSQKILTASSVIISCGAIPKLVKTIAILHNSNWDQLPLNAIYIIGTTFVVVLNHYVKKQLEQNAVNCETERLKTQTMLKSPTAIEIYKNVIYKDKQK